jgi:hypothetical protein
MTGVLLATISSELVARVSAVAAGFVESIAELTAAVACRASADK